MFRIQSTPQGNSRKISSSARRGFTLAEVLVTLAIIAVMAAVLLPALNQQITKGDTGRLASDLTNIQTASQAFVSDVHRYPGNTSQLTTAVTGNDVNGNSIPAALQAKWKGPYIGRDAISSTGAGGVISTTLIASSSYMVIAVSNLTFTDFANLEAILDEGSSATTSTTTGAIRYYSSTGSLYFFALPIQ